MTHVPQLPEFQVTAQPPLPLCLATEVKAMKAAQGPARGGPSLRPGSPSWLLAATLPWGKGYL